MMNLNTTINARFDAMGLTAPQKFTIGLHILTAFSAAIGHRPYVVKGEKTYGNLCMILVGKTGSGKGASCRFVKNIFSGYGEDLAAPLMEATRVSSMKTLLRAIHNVLSEETRESRGEIRLCHINEEFGNELRSAASAYHSGLGAFLCKLLEGSSISETLGRQTIEYALIHYSFMGHIQPDELKRCMREHLISSGCAGRFLWFEMPQGMTTPLPELTQEDKTNIADEIEESIRFAAAKRDVGITSEADEAYNKFLLQTREELPHACDKMQSLLPRFAQHALKLALVLSMLKRENEIHGDTMQDAIELVNLTRPTINKCFEAPSVQNVEFAILEAIKAETRIIPRKLYDKLLPHFSLVKIKSALKGLESARLIKLKPIGLEDGTFPKFYVAAE